MTLWQPVIYGRKFGAFGRGSALHRPIRIMGKKKIFIGNHVHILDNARMETVAAFGKKRFSPCLTIGDNTSIEQGFHAIASGHLNIGSEVTISGNVFVSDCYHNYTDLDTDVMNQPLMYARTAIGDYCFIGYGASIQPGAVLGKQVIVGSNAVVLKGEYPDHCVLAGVPAKIIKKYNESNGSWEKP